MDHEKGRNGEGQGTFSIRVMVPDDSEEAYNLVALEGWNLTLSKFKNLAHVFASFLFVMVNTETQEIVATVSALPTRPGHYIVGNLVVMQLHRGLGLGKRMMVYLMNKFQDKTLTLTSVPGMDAFYSKLGFKEVEPMHYVNFVEVDRIKVEKTCSELISDDINITNFTPDHFSDLNNYDKNARDYDNGKYLAVMIDTSDDFLMARSKQTGQIIGYVCGVDQSSHILVDGLYADSDAIALFLFKKLLEVHQDQTQFKLQVIKSRDFLLEFGTILPESHTYTRMAIGTTAPISLSKVYVVTDCDYSE